MPIAALDSDAEESDAFLAEQELTVLFTRSEDLYVARRAVPGSVFGSPAPITALNSAKDDRDAWATDDLRYVVFSSNRSGSYRLYESFASP